MDLPVFQREIPMAHFPAEGSGSNPLPIVIDSVGSGSLPLPAGLPTTGTVLVEMWGGGGAGAGGDSGHNGAGGNAGAYAQVEIGGALLALGGTMYVAGDVAGSEVRPGTDGGDTTITIDSLLRATAQGGKGGKTSSEHPPAAATVTVDESVTLVYSRDGTRAVDHYPSWDFATAGATSSAPGGGAGGTAGEDGGGNGGNASGYSSGGGGGAQTGDATSNGGDGARGHIRFTFYPS